MSTTSTTLVTSGTPWHPQSFADLAKRLQSEPEAVSHDVDFTFQALAMRSQTQQTSITQITNIINGKGTVSSVALSMPSIFGVAGSPITTSGTLAVTLLAETANLVWAGPASGPAAPPTFRALVAGDIPSLPYLPSSTVLPQTITKLAHEWLDSYSALTGLFTQSQPAIADLSDAANVVQTSRTISTTLPLTGGGDLSANRTLASNTFTGDSGSGGLQGDVPAPAAGDAAAGKFLKADGTWTTPPGAGSGTVTSVALTAPTEFTVTGSPVTTSGTLAIAKANQSANQVYAGPSTGAAAAPTFRSVVTADLPYTYSGNTTKLGTVAAGTLTSGHMATWDASGNLQDGGAPGGSGTVTSVGLSLPADITVTGSPVTTSGTLTGTWANENANVVHAGPTSGAAATPTWRALVASDIPYPVSATFTDDFSNSTLTGSLWITEDYARSAFGSSFIGGGSVSQTGGQMIVTPVTTASTCIGFHTKMPYIVKDLRYAVQIPTVAGASSGTIDTFIGAYDSSNSNSGYRITKEGTTLFFQRIINNTVTTVTSVTYNATTHLWWALFFDWTNRLVRFQTSSDGSTWTSATTYGFLINSSNVILEVGVAAVSTLTSIVAAAIEQAQLS